MIFIKRFQSSSPFHGHGKSLRSTFDGPSCAWAIPCLSSSLLQFLSFYFLSSSFLTHTICPSHSFAFFILSFTRQFSNQFSLLNLFVTFVHALSLYYHEFQRSWVLLSLSLVTAFSCVTQYYFPSFSHCFVSPSPTPPPPVVSAPFLTNIPLLNSSTNDTNNLTVCNQHKCTSFHQLHAVLPRALCLTTPHDKKIFIYF